MRNMILACSIAISFTACSPKVSLNPGAEAVKVMKSDPSSACEEVASLDAMVSGWPGTSSLDPYKNELRNKALAQGANYVRLDTVLYSEGGTIISVAGTAFRCP